MRHSEGSRDELPEAVSGSPSARNVSHGCEADRRGPWKRSVRGLLGETGRLGLARPGSAAEGRGDGCLLAWFLRAWSGPQAVSNVRRARGRRGPHKRRATIAIRSVSNGASSAFVNRQAYGSLTRVVNEGRGRSVQIQAGRDASRRVRFSRPAPSHRPHGSHTFGLGEVGQTFGSFFQRRGEGKSQRAPLASPQTSGVFRRAPVALPGPARLPLSDTRWPGWPCDSWFFPPHGGEGREPARAPGEGGTDLRPTSCPGEPPLPASPFPGPGHRPHGSHTFGLGEVGRTLGRIFPSRGGGGKPESCSGFPLTSRMSGGREAARPCPRRPPVSGPFHTNPPVGVGRPPRFLPCTQGRGKTAEDQPRLEELRIWPTGGRFFARCSPADRATFSGRGPPCPPRRELSNEPRPDPLRPS